MKQPKKMTGKGFTLHEFELPKDPVDIWVLVAESCYEISKTLLAQGSYTDDIIFAISGYNSEDPRGAISIQPEARLRYPSEIYEYIYKDRRAHELIDALFATARRVQVRVSCENYIPALFEVHASRSKKNFDLLEKIREKVKLPDLIGLGLEGCRKMRLRTYTPKRSDEIRRAFALLSNKPHLLELLGKTQSHYWHRMY